MMSGTLTAIGLLIFSAGIALVWAGITGKDALGEIRTALTSKKVATT